MKQILAISMLLVLAGCEDTVNIPKPSDSKYYFVCNKLDVGINENEDPERTLTINTEEKSIQVGVNLYEYRFTNTDQEVEAFMKPESYAYRVRFNKISGKLYIENPFQKSYQCSKVYKLMP